MTWIDIADDAHPKGFLRLINDKNHELATIEWFFDNGPFYCWAMDLKDTKRMRRLGPHDTLDNAKAACISAVEG